MADNSVTRDEWERATRARDEACAALKEANDALRTIAGLPEDADAEDARTEALRAALTWGTPPAQVSVAEPASEATDLLRDALRFADGIANADAYYGDQNDAAIILGDRIRMYLATPSPTEATHG